MTQETNGTNPEDIVLEEEFNWAEYQKDILVKSIKQYGSIERAVVEMDAKIASLKVEAEGLREMIEWDDEEEEG